MRTALAILPNSCARTALRPWFEARCQERGVKLRSLTVDEARGSFREDFRSERNVMAWNFRMLPAWMLCEGQNVLHLDNALISQKRGLYVDARGFFANSNLSRRAAESLKTLPKWNAEFYARRDFGWQAFHEGQPGGPVLVCLQCEKDSSVTQGFLRGQRGVRRMAELLRVVRQHLPVEPERVIIRPHPREPLGDLPEGLLDPRWQWSRDEKFAQVVRRCGAVVTVNSTCAHESVLAGVPVATLGTGTFTTWGATLECAGRPERLAELPGWRPDLEVAMKYVSHAMTRHFLPHDVRPERINPEFQTWLEDCI